MKKLLCLLVVLLSLLLVSGCNRNDSKTPAPIVAATNTTVNIKTLQAELSEIKNKYDNIIKIYDDSLEESVKTYCEKYLSFSGSATDNIKQIKDVVSAEYYSELEAQTGHKKSNEAYEQSTGLDKLYYGNYSSPSDNIEVIALCKQTVIYDDKVTTSDVTYTFNMLYESDNWVINSISAT